MMNTKLLSVVTQTYIYHGCCTFKTFLEEKFTGEERFKIGEFTAVNMRNWGYLNVRKHIEIKGSDNYLALGILLKFGSLYKKRITSSDQTDNL